MCSMIIFPHSPDQSFELLGCHSHYRFLNSLLSPALIVTAFAQFNQIERMCKKTWHHLIGTIK